MAEGLKKYTLEEAQLKLAKQTNSRVWVLHDKEERTAEEEQEMIHAAHTSLYHWSQVGTTVNLQRGEWLIGRVYTVLGDGQAALYYARRCMALTEAHRQEMADFDLAWADEGMARALALNGEMAEAKAHWEKARTAGEAIADDEDREIFMGDFNGGEWYGLNE